MIGVFDSGIGGLAAFKEIRTLLPRENIIYLADRKNAPYGTKNEDEITRLCTKNIRKLRDMGAERILIACCTASGVYKNLSAEDRRISIPIITPTAQEVANFSNRIAVIATERTVSSNYFSREIAKYSSAEIAEFAMQRLVYLVENGCHDGHLTYECHRILDDIRGLIYSFGADSLILGCTHFSHLEGELQALMPEIKIFSPAKIGAQKIVNEIQPHRECGRVIYT